MLTESKKQYNSKSALMNTTLDIPQEKKDLLALIAETEKEYLTLVMQVEQMKREMSVFQQIYEAKIGRLYERLNALDNQLFKYQHISEYVDDIFSFSEAT